MWRQAAEYREQIAELKWNELCIRERNYDPSRYSPPARHDSRDVKAVLAKMKDIVATAEYLHLAFKHRALPDAESRQNGTRVAVLYERIAEMMLIKQETSDPAPVSKCIHQHLIFINKLNGAVEVTESDIAERELLCGYEAVVVLSSDPVVQHC